MKKGMLRIKDGQIQIKALGGWNCASGKVQDALGILRNNAEIMSLQTKCRELEQKIECLRKDGCDYQFECKILPRGFWAAALFVSQGPAPDKNTYYQFKCRRCGDTIKKTEAKLALAEKKALQALGIIKGAKK